MIRRPPRSTRTDTLFPYTTLFRSGDGQVLDRRQPLARAFRKRDADRNLTVREREARAVLIDVAQRRDADSARNRRGSHTELGSEINARADDDLGPVKVAGDERRDKGLKFRHMVDDLE